MTREGGTTCIYEMVLELYFCGFTNMWVFVPIVMLYINASNVYVVFAVVTVHYIRQLLIFFLLQNAS